MMRRLALTCALSAAVGCARLDAVPADHSDTDTHSAPDIAAADGFACTSCVSDDECGKGQVCAQIFGSSWCAPGCGDLCPGELLCKAVQTTGGVQTEVCMPIINPCQAQDQAGVVNPGSTSPVERADVAHVDLPPPEPIAPLDLSGVTKLARFDLAVVGDTRPPFKNYTNSYPTAIITKIWSQVAQESPPAAFAVTTGDFQFSGASEPKVANAQFDLYLGARQGYPGTVLPVMGNHECTGSASSNCGPGLKDGEPALYLTYKERMLQPMGLDKPWYVARMAAEDGSWTAKIVVIAANAWSDEQATWLAEVLAQPTTYTIALRHEPRAVTEAPGVGPSNALLDKNPLTLLIVGHTHTASWTPALRQLVVGNGGAPPTGTMPYGYAMIRRRDDTALAFDVLHYQTREVLVHGAVWPTGTPAP